MLDVSVDLGQDEACRQETDEGKQRNQRRGQRNTQVFEYNREEKYCDKVRQLDKHIAESGGGCLVPGGRDHRAYGHPVRGGPVMAPHEGRRGRRYQEFPAQM